MAKLAPQQIARLRQASAGGAKLSVASASAVSSVLTQTREREVGDLFEYGIEKPVTVRRNQSALVPILLKPFAGQSVLLYQRAARPENPIRCVEFENTTGLTLEGGPVTVLEKGSYVGEAMLDTLKPKEKRLVGYAVELAVRVLDNIKTYRQRVSRVTIKQGTLISYHGQINQTTYTFSSKSDKQQILYLDHPRPGGDWSLTDTPAAQEITENYWRFRLTIPPNGSTKYVVRMQQTQSQSFALGGITGPQFQAWIEARFLDVKVEQIIRESFEVRQAIGSAEDKLKQLQAEREKINNEQKRIRENLGSLGDRPSEKELRERYIRTFTQQEDRLEKVVEEEKLLQDEKEGAKIRLANLIGQLEYDAPISE